MIQRRNRDDSIKYFNIRPSNTIAALPTDAVPTNPIFSNTAISATTNLTFPRRINKEATSWEEFLAQQTTWEKDIMQTISHLDLQTLLTRIMIGKPIYICLDGGANNKTGSFAAVLATDDRILVVLSGIVHGESPGSFRAEAVGMLSPLHYLQKLQRFYKLENIPSIYQYTDSNSLIKRIQERIKYIPCSDRAYMKSEIDVEMQIIQTIQNLAPKQHMLEYVKGHEDNQISIEKLPWKAKLNVYCDFIATKELNKIRRQQNTIQLLPASHIKLDIDGTTITHHMAS